MTRGDGIDFRPLFTPLTIPAILERSWADPAENPALSFVGDIPIRYRDLRDRVGSLAALFRVYGLGRGDKIALLGENHPNWGVAFFAITSIGAVAVPIMHEFPREDILRILDESASRAAVVSARFLSTVQGASLRLPGLFVVMEDLTVLDLPGTAGIFRPAASGSRVEDVQEDDPASLIYTSGTSGSSKGVVLTHKNLVVNAMVIDQMAGGVTEKDRLLSILPLAHATECTLGLLIPIMKKASISYLTKPPAASVLLPALKTVRPTIMIAVPMVIEKLHRSSVLPKVRRSRFLSAVSRRPTTRKALNRLLGMKLRRSFGGRLRMFCMGGAALAEDTAAFLDEAKFPYSVGYGLTEASPQVTGDPPATFVSGSSGRPLAGVAVRISDPDPATGEGEIEVKGANVMAGYYAPPGLNPPASPFTADGWLKTGDIGVLDSRGYLFVRGRHKNVIVHSSGKKTFPEAIENLLNQQRFVVDSLVREEAGLVVASVELNGADLMASWGGPRPAGTDRNFAVAELLKKIMSDVNRRLPPWSRLRRVTEQTTPFEKTPSQKVKRYRYAG
jgi:long-chain acyl-CoA synthetase